MKKIFECLKKIRAQHASFTFFEQLYPLHQMGFSILQSLSLLKTTNLGPLPPKILTQIHSQLEQGLTFCQTLENNKDYFNPMTLIFARIAEQSHDFFTIINIWVQHQKKLKEMKNRIYAQCSYPLFLCFLWVFFILFFSQNTLPKLQSLAQQLGTPKVMSSSSYYAGFSLIIPIYFRKSLIKKWSFKKKWDWWIWSSIMHMGRQMGLSDLQSLEITEHHFKNLHQIDWIQHTIQQVRMGTPLEDCFHGTPTIIQQYLPFLHHQQAFEKLSIYFHQSLEKYLKRLERYLQPTLLFFIAILAASALWMMYQPLLEIGTQI